ncbi:MAG: transcriptional regulator of arginine metabolism, partial [Frankiaceae bacterium]|nr:transcriptional regulator of arginine metabolism [Frankiaceae bacterium]
MSAPAGATPLDAARSTAGSRSARRRRILDLLARQPVRSQSELQRLLAEMGVAVTQATLSRDLEELGAVKVRDEAGALMYAAPPDSAPIAHDRLGRALAELLVSAEHSANIVVL